MKDFLKKSLKFLVFLSLGVFLFWYVYKDQPISKIEEALLEANYSWILLSMVIGIFSHIFRALRWRMFIEPLGYKVSFSNAFNSVMVGYLANLAFPRMGEVTRCAVIKKYEKIPLTQSLGTILVERVIDLLILALLTVFVIITRYPVLIELLSKPEIQERLDQIGGAKSLLIVIGVSSIATLALIYYFRNKFRNNKIYMKVSDLIKSIITGIKSIKNVKNKGLFVLYSFLIWFLYFMMLYVCFFCFDFTSNLGVLTGITMFVLGSYGMVAPVQGGIGAWHFMVSTVLVINGLSEINALSFAFVAHGFQTLMLVIVGTISLLLLPITNRSVKK